jgi:hypothetical protein
MRSPFSTSIPLDFVPVSVPLEQLAGCWAEDSDEIILRRCPVCEQDSIVGHGRRRKQAQPFALPARFSGARTSSSKSSKRSLPEASGWMAIGSLGDEPPYNSSPRNRRPHRKHNSIQSLSDGENFGGEWRAGGLHPGKEAKKVPMEVAGARFSAP